MGVPRHPDVGSAAARRAGERAAAVARASARVPGPALELAPGAGRSARGASEWVEHPLDDVASPSGPTCSWARRGDAATPAPLAQASHQIWDTEKWFASSEGSRIDQHIVECGAVIDATAIGDGETQRRSYPGVRGQYGTRGWELVRELDLLGNAARIAEEAQALLPAPQCPETTTPR